jgi:hypothetical protein
MHRRVSFEFFGRGTLRGINPSSGQSAQQSGFVGGSCTFWILLIVK